MALTRTEKERISDSRLKIRSVAHSLTQVDPKKVRNLDGIQDCLQDADKNLTGALKSDEGK